MKKLQISVSRIKALKNVAKTCYYALIANYWAFARHDKNISSDSTFTGRDKQQLFHSMIFFVCWPRKSRVRFSKHSLCSVRCLCWFMHNCTYESLRENRHTVLWLLLNDTSFWSWYSYLCTSARSFTEFWATTWGGIGKRAFFLKIPSFSSFPSVLSTDTRVRSLLYTTMLERKTTLRTPEQNFRIKTRQNNFLAKI